MVAKKPVCIASLPIATIERESYTQTLSSVTIVVVLYQFIVKIIPTIIPFHC